MYKSLFLICVFLLVSAHVSYAAQSPFIISGFDDVLRQAENTGILKSAIRILEKDRGFSGMQELYSTITKQEGEPKFAIVSAISIWFDGRIDKFLKDVGFPTHRRYLRNCLTQWSIEDFKIDKIKEVIAERPGREFIVIFDNSDASLILAKELSILFPTAVKAIYLRQVVEKEIPPSATSFFSAFDIALGEFKAGRLTADQVEAVGNSILREKNLEMIFPSYAICPVNYNPCVGAPGAVVKICDEVKNSIQSGCQLRGH